MPSLPGNIDTQILKALNFLFTRELITNPTNTNPADPLILRVLKQDPLQDDPTLASPYVLYKPDHTRGFKIDRRGGIEIGGPVHYRHAFLARCGTSRAITRDGARDQISELVQRTMYVLIRFFDLSGLIAPGALMTPDGGKVLEGESPVEVESGETQIYGGESEWYGRAEIEFCYSVSWYVPLSFLGHP